MRDAKLKEGEWYNCTVAQPEVMVRVQVQKDKDVAFNDYYVAHLPQTPYNSRPLAWMCHTKRHLPIIVNTYIDICATVNVSSSSQKEFRDGRLNFPGLLVHKRAGTRASSETATFS